jgi:hypothetical protein
VSGVKSVDGVAVGADVGFRLWDPERRRQPPPPPTPSDAQGPPD